MLLIHKMSLSLCDSGPLKVFLESSLLDQETSFTYFSLQGLWPVTGSDVGLLGEGLGGGGE